MANIRSNPTEFLFIHNSQIINFDDCTDEYVMLIVKDFYGNITHYEGRYYPTNGKCRIDISGVLKSLVIPTNDIDYSQVLNAGSSMIGLNVIIDSNNDGEIYNQIHYCIFGVIQILEKGIEYYVNARLITPETENMWLTENKWLTGFTKPKCWKGYPFSLSFIYGLETDSWLALWLNGGLIVLNENMAAKQLFHAVINTNSLPFLNNINVFEDEESHVQLTEILEFNCISTIPCTPVYLRWLNQLGGYDYFMFYKKDIKESPKTSYINKYPDSLQPTGGYHSGTMKPYLKQSAETWVIAADNLTLTEFNELRKICRSMRVDMYVAESQSWLGVNVIDSTYTVPLDEELIDVELNLIMPEILTQC